MSDFKRILPVVVLVLAVIIAHASFKSTVDEDIPVVDQEHIFQTSVGLEFALNEDKLGYTVTGLGTCKEADVVLDSYDNLPITHIADKAFLGCTGIKSMTLTHVASIGKEAFYGCTRLRSITLPEGITEIPDYAFYGCERLSGMTLPNSIQRVGESAFYGCERLKSVTIPEGAVSIGTEAFWGCTSLEKISIADSVTNISCRAFRDTAYYNNQDNWDSDVLYIGHHLVTANATLSGEYAVKDGTKTICNDAFFECDHLTKVILPDSVVSIGEEAFYECKHLSSVNLPSNLQSIGKEAFYECRRLTTLSLPNSIKSIGSSTFDGCRNLTDIVIGSGVTSIETGAFYDSWNLEKVFYRGNEAQWADISISDNNDILDDTTIYFYSEEQPSTAGSFWHEVDGEPVIWYLS